MKLLKINSLKTLMIALITLVLLGFSENSCATIVKIVEGNLSINGEPFIIKSVGYSPVPIGVDPETTPPYGDCFTPSYSAIYERDLPLLRQMGANTIRLWGWNNTADHTDFLAKAYNHGVNPIYVIVTFGMDPSVYPDISSPGAREQIKADFRAMVAAYKDHPAVLMWSIGNELNSPEIYGDKLDDLFSLVNEMAQEAHAEEGKDYHPVAIPLADVDIINTIATYDPIMDDLDIWGANIYRGASFGALFNDFKGVSRKPLVIMEFGIDAYDDKAGDEYENIGMPYQATYAESLWKEILANLDVCIGGSIRAYSDEWWPGKLGNTFTGCPDQDPAFHSICGHPSSTDLDGSVNYEWFGIMRTIKNGSNIDIMEPRKAYSTLRSLWTTEETQSPSGIDMTPDYASSIFQSAEADWKAHRWEEALKKYREVSKDIPPMGSRRKTVSSNPYASKAHIQIGKYYKYYGRWNEAIAEYENAVAKAVVVRDIEDAQTSIAAVYLSKGNYQKALSIFRDVISKTNDWQQVKYSTYWVKELKRRMAFGEDASGCNTCGPNALKVVFRLKGIEFSDDEVDRMLRLANGGASIEDIKQLANSKGLKAYGVKLSIEQLKGIGKPLIALVDDPNHYVIITGFEPRGIRIIDPENSSDPYLMPEKEFEKVWKGHALVFSEVNPEMVTALLSTDDMKNLKGKVCYCCPEGNNGTQTPNTNLEKTCVNPTLLINTVNLNLIVQEMDLSYSDRGPDIEITRTYNADDSRDGPFGRSWTFNYNVTLTENPSGSVDIRRETGTIHHFNSAGDGRYYSPKGVYDTLIKNTDGTYSLKLKGSKITQKFSSDGKLISITDRNGNSVTLQYDPTDRLVSITDAVGRVTTLTYGANGKISSLRDPLGRTATYSYDSNDNMISTTDMAGRTVSYTYDNPTCQGGTCSYMTSITTSKGTTRMTYTTSSDGYALKSIIDPIGNVKSYGTYGSYDDIKITDANGNPIYYKNNSDGYTEKIADSLGNAVTYGYDTRGTRTSIQDANGNTTSLTYDTKGNITSISDPLRNSAQFTYDGNDNLTRLVGPAGNAYVYEYDSRDNLTKITDPENGVTTFTYNSYGELTTLTDAKSNSINFTYDSSGNLTTVANPLGRRDSYTYDTVGRVATHTDPKGNTKSYSYDGINRISEIRYPNGSVKSYTYDCCSLSTITDPNGTLTFTYDNINRPISLKDVHGKTILYSYDNVGNLTSITYPDGKVVSYEYDKADRLIKVTDWLNNVTVYEYNSVGNLLKTIYPNGSTVIHQYDNASRLKSILDYKTDATVNAVFNYTIDPVGNRTGISSYQPINVNPAPPNVSYTYDTENRLLTAGSTTFNYDNNGNIIIKTLESSVVNYTWDYNNMLNQIVNGGKIYNYKYDGLANRIAKIENSFETRYVVDTSGVLSQVLAETDASGNITAYYVYGLGLISKITPDGQVYYYHYDGLGSTIAITDSSGNIVNKYAYDAFGKVVSQTEAIPNPFKYVGRYGVMDDGNGLLYMRARYYDSEAGRFINKDPIGLLGGLNMYAYVGNNPVYLIDPLGLQSNNNQCPTHEDCVSKCMQRDLPELQSAMGAIGLGLRIVGCIDMGATLAIAGVGYGAIIGCIIGWFGPDYLSIAPRAGSTIGSLQIRRACEMECMK